MLLTGTVRCGEDFDEVDPLEPKESNDHTRAKGAQATEEGPLVAAAQKEQRIRIVCVSSVLLGALVVGIGVDLDRPRGEVKVTAYVDPCASRLGVGGGRIS